MAGPTTLYTYDRADRLTNAGGVAVTTDANGNLVARGPDVYTYDQADQLSSATTGGTSETYIYDGIGTRFSRQIGAGTPTRYISDVVRELPVVIDDGTSKFVYGLGLTYAVTGSAIEVFHANRLTSTRAVTNASGVVTAASRSDEWGVLKASSGSSSQPFGYTGEPTDATGLSYLRARYYNSDLGRFMSRDTWFGSALSPQIAQPLRLRRKQSCDRKRPIGPHPRRHHRHRLHRLRRWQPRFRPECDRPGNWLALGADTGAAFIPFVTGAGIVVRGSAHAAIDANKLHHLFTSAKAIAGHGLDDVVIHYGSEEAAFRAIEKATQAAVAAGAKSGYLITEGKHPGEYLVKVAVAGQEVTVTGKVIDGVVRIGTAYIP